MDLLPGDRVGQECGEVPGERPRKGCACELAPVLPVCRPELAQAFVNRVESRFQAREIKFQYILGEHVGKLALVTLVFDEERAQHLVSANRRTVTRGAQPRLLGWIGIAHQPPKADEPLEQVECRRLRYPEQVRQRVRVFGCAARDLQDLPNEEPLLA